MTFDFVNDDQIKKLLIRDYDELEKCFQNKLSKSVLILSGSILEAVLIDYFTSRTSDLAEINKLNQLSLGELIQRANDDKVIGNNNKNFSSGIQGYRNLIHPGREMRLKENFDQDTAALSFSALKLILKEVEIKTLSSKGRTADEIFGKLMNDGLPSGLFKKITDRLNRAEKNKLFLRLVAEDINDEQFGMIDYPFDYAKHLLETVDFKTIEYLARQLLKEAESGSKIKALKYSKYLFRRFNEFFEIDEIDIIVDLYLQESEEMLSTIQDAEFLIQNRIIDAIFFNKKTFDEIHDLFTLTSRIAHYYNKNDNAIVYLDLWKIIHGLIDEQNYLDLVETFEDEDAFKKFYDIYYDGDYLPF